MNAVLYARVSSKEQAREGFSIPAQQKLLREYAASNGLTIVNEFTDVETAKTTGRTNFNEMLKFLRQASLLSHKRSSNKSNGKSGRASKKLPDTEHCKAFRMSQLKLPGKGRNWMNLLELFSLRKLTGYTGTSRIGLSWMI